MLDLKIWQEIKDNIPGYDQANCKFLLCGPEGMMRNAEQLLIADGVKPDQIMKESFTASTQKAANQNASSSAVRKVILHYEGNRYEIEVLPGTSILETALDENIDLPFSCQAGLCTACRGKLISGKVEMNDAEGLTQDEKDQGYVLTCVGHPLTDDVEIEIG